MFLHTFWHAEVLSLDRIQTILFSLPPFLSALLYHSWTRTSTAPHILSTVGVGETLFHPLAALRKKSGKRDSKKRTVKKVLRGCTDRCIHAVSKRGIHLSGSAFIHLNMLIDFKGIFQWIAFLIKISTISHRSQSEGHKKGTFFINSDWF